MYSVVSIIYGIVTTIFTGYCLTYYFDSFMEQKKMLKGRGKYLILASYVILDYLMDALFQTNFETKETIGKQLLLLVVVFGLAKSVLSCQNADVTVFDNYLCFLKGIIFFYLHNHFHVQ